MTPATIQEVDDFVGLVRLYLGDLDDVVRDELTDGLAADLTELVDDRGVDALPDPEAYADELRAAAGLGPRPARSLLRRERHGWPELSRWSEVDIDRAVRLGASEFVGFVRSLRPVWWMLRGWLAASALDLLVGASARVSPAEEWPLLSDALIIGLTVVSVQVGRGRCWTAWAHGVAGRLVLALVDVVCLLVLLTSLHDIAAFVLYDAR